MLTYNDLVFIEGALREHTVLTVYVNGEERDPSKRRQWRIELRHALDDIDRWLIGSSHAEREAFASCRTLVEERLGASQGVVRAPGWVGFFTTEGEHFASPVPVATPTMAAWSTGPALAPCVRVLKEARPVIVAVMNSRAATLYRYADRIAELIETIQARASVDAERHMGRPPVAGFHVGTRGPTGRDRAQRELRNATTHMLADVAGKLTELAGRDGWILVGGIPTVALAALRRLRPELAHRTAHVASLTASATLAEIGEAAPPSFLANHAVDTETAVRIALSTRALVEQVSGVAAERLDHAGGIAAALRYPSIAAMPSVAGWTRPNAAPSE